LAINDILGCIPQRMFPSPRPSASLSAFPCARAILADRRGHFKRRGEQRLENRSVLADG
jgi:hypothetical protein